MSESWSDPEMDRCEVNGLLYYHPVYIFAIFFQGLSSVAAFPVMFVVIKNHALKVYYHSNLVFLVSLNAASCLIIAGLSVWSAANFFINIITKPNPCDLLMRTSFCSNIRAIFLFAFCLISTSHVGILIERIWATVNVKSYEKQGKVLGGVLAVLAAAVSIITIVVVLHNENGNELITTCLTFSASKSVGNQIYLMFLVQFIIDGLISIIHFSLFKYNKHFNNGNTGSLSEQFQRNENVKALKQITPLLILSNVTIGVYIFVISIFRLYKVYLPPNWYEIIAALLFIMPHMPLMFSSLLLIEFHREKKRLLNRHTQIMANQNIPLADQFNIPMEHWDAQFESRSTSLPKSSSPKLWSLKSIFRKNQSQVAVNVIS